MEGGPNSCRKEIGALVSPLNNSMDERTVVSQFDTMAAAKSRKGAIYWGTETIHYTRLREQIHLYAANLHTGHGVRQRNRVGILLKNSPEFIYVLYGALKLGAVVVPINNFLKAPEIQHIVDDCQLDCLVTSRDFEDTLARVNAVRSVGVSDLQKQSGAAEPQWPDIRRFRHRLDHLHVRDHGQTEGSPAFPRQHCVERPQLHRSAGRDR